MGVGKKKLKIYKYKNKNVILKRVSISKHLLLWMLKKAIDSFG